MQKPKRDARGKFIKLSDLKPELIDFPKSKMQQISEEVQDEQNDEKKSA